MTIYGVNFFGYFYSTPFAGSDNDTIHDIGVVAHHGKSGGVNDVMPQLQTLLRCCSISSIKTDRMAFQVFSIQAMLIFFSQIFKMNS